MSKPGSDLPLHIGNGSEIWGAARQLNYVLATFGKWSLELWESFYGAMPLALEKPDRGPDYIRLWRFDLEMKLAVGPTRVNSASG